MFEELHEVVKRFCFAVDDEEISAILQEYRIKEGCSYRKTVLLMNEELSKIMASKKEKIKNLAELIAQMKKISYEKDLKWEEEKKFMESEVERYKQLANI